MSLFDNIIDDVATRFGLGAKAGPLLRELLLLMTGSPGGIGGFIDKFKSAGLSGEASGWLGNPYGTALSSSQVEQALGGKTVDTIAKKVGLTGAAASAAIGYLAPKVIGQLTPDGVVGPGIPSSVSDFLRSSTQAGTVRPEQTMPYGAGAARASAGPGRWIAPLLALLALGGIGWYFLGNQTRAPVAITSAPVTTTPASVVPSRLAISNDNGVVTFSGTVRDQAARTSIIDSLNGVFGSNAVKGDIVVDPNAASTPWLANLRSALEQFKMPGLQAVFDGNSLNLGGTVGDADRDRLLTSLKSTFGSSGLTFAAADRMSSLVSDATNKATAALAALGTGFRTTALLDILNKSIINFPTGNAEIPAVSRALLQQAATPFKQLPAGTVVEIGGYTDNTGDPTANLQLSQHRADAVRNALIQSGVNPGMLVAKGYGSANPVASNDTAEGRFQNRRIAYQVSDRSRVTEGSGR
ncbi:MAG: OmpA family protein [Rhizobiales bacterium]|nr:OmpA family protein [Hyphomicrobiales bacterium]